MSYRENQLIGGRYRLLRPLARGGMGAVWVARHTELEVDVAVKFRAFSDGSDARGEQRFKREAQAAARLKSPHVVHVYDYGIDAGTPYIAMELLEGQDLGELLEQEGRLAPRRALALLTELAKALKQAHELGIVHRDIKPSNLFLARSASEARLKVLDFGIAKDVASGEDHATTSVGTVLGSAHYMSPEQARGHTVDARSDLWSMAAVAFRMLTGEPPFLGTTSHDVVVKLCTERAQAPSALVSELPRALDEFFERAFARDPERRFQSVDELMTALAASVGESADEALPTAVTPLPTVIGRSSVTESIRAPRFEIRTERRTPGRRWVWLAAGAALIAAVLGVSLTRQEIPAPRVESASGDVTPPPPVEPVQQLPVDLARPEPAEPIHPVTDERPALEPGKTAHAKPHAKPEPVAAPPRPKSITKSAPPADEPLVDPVFGLPRQEKKEKTP